MNSIHYDRRQVALMMQMASTKDFALLAGKKLPRLHRRSKSALSAFGLRKDGQYYVWDPR